MSGAQVLGLVTASDATPESTAEFLRLLLAARAAGLAVALVDLRAESSPLDAALPESASGSLATLAADGVTPSRPSPVAHR